MRTDILERECTAHAGRSSANLDQSVAMLSGSRPMRASQVYVLVYRASPWPVPLMLNSGTALVRWLAAQ